jgi:RNA polymerase sigma-70 factor (ECF subfamily)
MRGFDRGRQALLMTVAPSQSPDLLRRVSQGDKAAMRECLQQYGGLVWSLARSFTRTLADAEDAAQDVFVHLWQKAGQYDPAYGQEVQFISVLARRRLIDWVRSKSRSQEFAVPAAQAIARSIDRGSFERDEEAAAAWEAISRLISEHQSIVLLAVVHGLTHEQIATHLKMPLGTVKTNLYRALASVREHIAQREVEREAAIAQRMRTPSQDAAAPAGAHANTTGGRA